MGNKSIKSPKKTYKIQPERKRSEQPLVESKSSDHTAQPGPGKTAVSHRRVLRTKRAAICIEKLLEEVVCNDAQAPISKEAAWILTKGLSFAPNSRSKDKTKLSGDLERLRRTINLKLHFNLTGEMDDVAKKSHVSKIIRSDWCPPEALASNHQVWIRLLNDCDNSSGKFKKNVPDGSIEAYKKLINDERWYVLKADKGGKTVIWGRDEYRKEALRQLKDESTYRELTKEQADKEYKSLKKVKNRIIGRLLKAGNITKTESERLLNEETKVPCIYFLPKIHKEKRADTSTFSARPITAAVGSMMKSLDEYLAHVTAVLLREIPGSLMDTGALIRDLAKVNNLSENAMLFSADVESLYPSIPWDEGIAAATGFYASKFHILLKDAKERGLLAPPNPRIFKQILSVILKRNIFHFQDMKWFRQLKGTAMGCSMSVFLANTFMYKRTKSLLDAPVPGLKYIGRYIDDLIAVWDDKEELNVQNLFSKTIDQNIKLTYVLGGKSLEALDLLLTLESDGTISTRLYRKPTDGRQYVHWTSAHPAKLKASIPYAQLLRIKRNCSRNEDFLKEAASLLDVFRSRGYPREVLSLAFERAKNIERKSLLITGNGRKSKVSDGRLCLVTDYNEMEAENLKKSVNSFYKRLLTDPLIESRVEYLGAPLPNMAPRIAFRAGRTLGSCLGPIFKKGQRLD